MRMGSIEFGVRFWSFEIECTMIIQQMLSEEQSGKKHELSFGKIAQTIFRVHKMRILSSSRDCEIAQYFENFDHIGEIAIYLEIYSYPRFLQAILSISLGEIKVKLHMPVLMKKIAEINKRVDDNIVWFAQVQKRNICAKTTIPFISNSKQNSVQDIRKQIQDLKTQFRSEIKFILNISGTTTPVVPLTLEDKTIEKLKLTIKFEQLKCLYEKNRRKREKSSEGNLTYELFQNFSIRESSEEVKKLLKNRNDQKFSKDITKYSESWLKLNLENQKKLPKFARLIEMNQKKDEQKKGHCEGGFGIIKKYWCIYRLFKDLSLFNETNKLLERSQERTGAYEQMQGFLMEKRSLSKKQEDIRQEKKIIMMLRDLKSRSLCSYFLEKNISKAESDSFYMEEYIKTFSELKVSVSYLVKIFFLLAEGLYTLGKNLIVHRDLKPQNIMFDKKCIPKIIDFGSACKCFESNQNMGATSQLKTTQFYNKFYNENDYSIQSLYSKEAYEQHPLFDIYAFGKILQKIMDQLNLTGVEPTVRENLKYIADRCTQLNPADRFEHFELLIFLKKLVQYESFMK